MDMSARQTNGQANVFALHGFPPSAIRSERTEGLIVKKGQRGVELSEVVVYGSEHDVRLAMQFNGICGSDVQKIASHGFRFPAWADMMTIGHEGLGRTTEPFECNNGTRVPVGTWVVPVVTRLLCRVRPHAAPPACVCRPYLTPGSSGTPDGLLSRTVFYPRELVLPIPAELAPYAVLSEPLAVVEKGLRRLVAAASPAALQQPALVVGLGQLGLFATARLRDSGCPQVVAIDRVPRDSARVRLFTQLVGGDGVYLQAPDDVAAYAEQFEVVVEAAGGATSLRLALHHTRGSLLAYGIPEHEEPLEAALRTIVSRDLRLIGSVSNAGVEDFRRTIDTLSQWRVTRQAFLDALVGSYQVPLADYRKAFEEAATGNQPKVIITM